MFPKKAGYVTFICIFLMIPVILVISAAVDAQPRPIPLTWHTILPNKIYWVSGGGGNSGVLIGENGVVVIDAKITPAAGKRLVADLSKRTNKPITHVIETHSDGDHINGITGFPENVKIIAHINNKMEQLVVPLYAAVEIDGGKCLPPQDRLPNMLVYGNKRVAMIDGEKFVFYHYGPAHTSGDLVVYLPAYKIAFVGDLITSSVLVHPEKGGSFAGWFNNARHLLQLDAVHYLGGHAQGLDTKESLRKRITAYEDTRDEVDAMIAQGKSLAQIKTAMGDPDKDRSGCRGIPYPTLSWVEYHEQTSRLEKMN